MATSKPSHLREKSSSPSSFLVPISRRSPRPPGSPDRRLPTTSEKPAAPHLLKPKLTTSSTTRSFHATPPHPSTASKRQPMKKQIEKPPSPSRRPEGTLSTPLTARTRERSPKPPFPSPVSRPYLRSTSSLPLDKGPKTVKSAKSNAGTYTRSQSLEKRKVLAIPNAFVDMINSASDSEASVVKVKPEMKEAEKALPLHVDDVPKTEEEQEHGPGSPVHEQVESPGVQSEVLVTENKAVHEERAQQADSPAEVTEETTEAMSVGESPKEPLTEPAEEVKLVATKEAPPRSVVAAKKEAQRSNDAIEEAKSKFLEKRKNKVLALVGAFETVMALQEPEGH